MIRFFRNIRQKLVAENKVMAYLRYAIGEIVLVVIGILIALQINNWNETRKENISENEFKRAVKNDLKNDKEYIQVIISDAEKKISAYKLLNKELPELYITDKKAVDSLLQIYFVSERTFYPITGSFQSAVSGSEIGKFKDKKTIKMLLKLYNSVYDRLIDNGVLLDNRWEYLVRKYSHIRRSGHLGKMNQVQISGLLDDLSYHSKGLVYYVGLLRNTIVEIGQLLKTN